MRKIAQRMFAILLLLLPLTSLSLMAQLENGKVYNFVNYAKNNSLVALSMSKVSFGSTSQSDYSQLWYAEADGQGRFTLRNLSTGMYLCKSNPWNLVPDKSSEDCHFFDVQSANGRYYISSTSDASGYSCMHCDINYGTIVSWLASDVKSEWDINPVAIDSKTLEDNWKAVDDLLNAKNNVAIYQGHLDALFSDKACTQLKVSNVESNEHYQALPVTLQRMVLKVQNNNWYEDNAKAGKLGWDSDYAKKYRVQLYEPYSDPVESSKALKINKHSNLNNPTGLYANTRQALYVMVEGTIKPGSELYIGSYLGHGRPDGDFRHGQKLSEGLNVVPYWSDGNSIYINYVVETFKDGKMTEHKLSQYDPLKIHIEGGHINGYFNGVGDDLYPADKDADWDYCEARANMEDITILGKYQTLQFYLHEQPQGNDPHAISPGVKDYFTEKASVEKVIAEWDRIVYSERLTMGMLSKEEVDAANKLYPTLDNPSRGIYNFIGGEENGFYKDYSDSYRLHGLSLGLDHAYMYASDEYSGYNINTFDGIIGKIVNEAGPTWGPAHEIGHQHQAVLNMHGLTEVSNNIFSNVAVWYKGMATSRINGGEGCLQSVLGAYNQEKHDFFTNNIWAQTQMYYKLWMYYHLTGHNNKFYPRLFELLRNYPMTIPGGSRENPAQQDGAKCLLHFYKMCCKAAEEDLTEFFKAYGFFSVMQDRFVEDYTPAIYNMTQKQIDDAIAEVKSWNYPVNYTAILINDGTDDKTFGHDGTSVRSIWDEQSSSELGCYIGFYPNKENKMVKPYHCSVEGNVVSMTGGQGGVGFLIYGKNNELLSFSDCYTFKISSRAQAAFAKGEAKVYVANGDNSLTKVVVDNSSDIERAMLATLLQDVGAMLQLQDASYTKVGYYLPESLTELQKAKDQAQKIYDAGKEGTYAGAYVILSDAYVKVKKDEYAKVGIIEGNAYSLENKLYPGWYMDITTDYKMLGSQKLGNPTEGQKWYLESVGGDIFAVKSKRTNSYMKELVKSSQHVADASQGTVTYKLQDMGNGYFALTCQDKDGQSIHCDGYKHIVGWDATADGSQWRLVAVESSPVNTAKASLNGLIDRTERLVGQMAVVSDEVALQTTDPTAPGYLYCNAPYTNVGGDYSNVENGYNLLDKNANTHLHTDYSKNDSKDGLDHYLSVDLGEGDALSEFVLRYQTRNSDTDEKPKTMVVEGSLDGHSYDNITTLSNLPSGKSVWFEQSIKAAQSYRYFRFMVTETHGGGVQGGHQFFSMAEFEMKYSVDRLVSVEELYKEASVELEAAVEQLNNAKNVVKTATTESEINEAKATLEVAYQNLEKAYDLANNPSLKAKRQQLQTLMEQTSALVNECGSVVETAGGAVALQVTNENAAGYLSSNADQNTGGGNADGTGIAGLCDNDPSTYFHSRWGGTLVDAPHFVQVDLGKDVLAGSFKFSYAVRQHDKPLKNSPAPSEIKILGSNDGSNFSPIVVLNAEVNGLPTYTNLETWTSENQVSESAYRYLRFAVTKSVGPSNAQYGGQYFFAMSEFNLELIPTTSVVINANCEAVTKDLLLETHRGLESAKTVLDFGTAENQFDEAITALQAQHDALQIAREASPAYVQLNNYYNSENLIRNTLVLDEKIGCYSAVSAEAYNKAYASASQLVSLKNGNKESYIGAYNDLKVAFEGLTMIVPEAGKLYVLRSAHKDYAKNALVYVNADNKMQFSAEVTNVQSNAVWTFEPTAVGQFIMKSLHTGEGVGTFTSNKMTPLTAEAKPLSLVALDGLGQVNLVANGTKMHAQQTNSAIVAYDGGVDSPSAWYIEEVKNQNDVAHKLTVSDFGYAGLYLNYNAVIPEGTTAYVATQVSANGVSLAPISGSVLPARTAVIVKAPAAEYSFNYTSEMAAPVENDKLMGSTYTQFLQGEPNMNYYLFGVKNGKVGLYKAWLEYDMNGTLGEGNVFDDTDNGGYFKVSANKVYLPESASVSANSLFFIFDDITGIEHVATDLENAEIYDLQGRRVNKVQKSGLYIVNGQKRFVKI